MIRSLLAVALSGVAALIFVIGAAVLSSAQTPSKKTVVREDLLERLKKLDKSPLIFYIAHGELDTCGEGCDRWIAVEGQFDLGSAERFSQFIARHAKPKLPIFFHSTGGLVDEALEIGKILRQGQFVAGIGFAIPNACDVTKLDSPDCRKVKTSGKEVAAELRELRAACASACVYALLGAPHRHVAPSAALSVHQTLASTFYRDGRPADPEILARDKARYRQYMTTMGVDAALFDLAAKVASESVHILTRDEIARFRIDTREFAETRWAVIRQPSGQFITEKAIIQAIDTKNSNYISRSVGIACANKRDSLWLGYLRPDPKGGSEALASIGLKIGHVSLWLSPGQARVTGEKEVRGNLVGIDAYNEAIAAKTIGVVETGTSFDHRFILSTAGLQAAIDRVTEHCVNH